MEPVVSAIRMNPFAAGILQLAVKDVLERCGCREYAIDPETGDVDAQVAVNGRESRFLFLLHNPFLEVAVTEPHPALSQEEAYQAADALAARAMRRLAPASLCAAVLAVLALLLPVCAPLLTR